MLSRINTGINTGNGMMISNYFNITNLADQKEQLHSLIKEAERFNFQNKGADWRKIFSNLFSIPSADSSESEYQFFDRAAQTFIYEFCAFDDSLRVPILREISHSYRKFADKASVNDDSKQFGDCVQKVRDVHKVCKKAGSEPYSDYGCAYLSISNDLIYLFFAKNDVDQAKKMFDIIQGDFPDVEIKGMFTVSELATFFFGKGKVYTILNEPSEAIELLEKSLSYIPLEEYNDRRMVYSLLTADKLALGMIPSKELMEKYHLEIYKDISQAIIDSNLLAFNEALESNALTLIRLGTWDLISKSKLFIYRRIIQIVYEEYKKDATKQCVIVPIETIREAVSVDIEHSREEIEAILANLVFNRLVGSNIFDSLGKAVFPLVNAFPELPIPDAQ